MTVEDLMRLYQTSETTSDVLLTGMVDSLVLQMKRAVSVRETGLVNQMTEVEVKQIKLQPEQVVIQGKRRHNF